ncbi:MAG TPA: hypothetical protein PL041_05830 [Melioribacteraceae bacterium]|nr:hypothetical protein [Melioribacteraceae bacterium]
MANKILLLTFLFLNCALAQIEKSFYVASWNVENLFDTLDCPDKDDSEFLPSSEKKWNTEKYKQKLTNLAKVINDMNDNNGPDILGLVETENINVVNDLINVINLSNNKNYKVVHIESPDPRGIDNALIFNSDFFNLIDSKPLHVYLDSSHSETRYILKVELQLTNGNNEKIKVFVNHWPSRRGGEDSSEKFRITAAKVLEKEINLSDCSIDNIIIVGDFNDEPNNNSIKEILNAKSLKELCENPGCLFNLSTEKKENGEGTYYYRGNWNMLDQMIISRSLLKKGKIQYNLNSFEIIKPLYMITKEGRYEGSTIPTFGGKKYLGGYSDHFPIGAKFSLISE